MVNKGKYNGTKARDTRCVITLQSIVARWRYGYAVSITRIEYNSPGTNYRGYLCATKT